MIINFPTVYEESTFAATDEFDLIRKRAQVSTIIRKRISNLGLRVFLDIVFGLLPILILFIGTGRGFIDIRFSSVFIPIFSIMLQGFIAWDIVAVVKVRNSGEAISKQMEEPELDAFLSMNKEDQRNYAFYQNIKLRKPCDYTSSMDWKCKQLLNSHMGCGMDSGLNLLGGIDVRDLF